MTKARSLIKTNVQTLPQSVSNYSTSVDFHFDNSPEMKIMKKVRKICESFVCENYQKLGQFSGNLKFLKRELNLKAWIAKNWIQERQRRCQLQTICCRIFSKQSGQKCSIDVFLKLNWNAFPLFCRFIFAIESNVEAFHKRTRKQLDEKFIVDFIESWNNLSLKDSMHEILRMRESASKQSRFKLRFAIKLLLNVARQNMRLNWSLKLAHKTRCDNH